MSLRRTSGSAELHARSHLMVKLPAQILSPSARSWMLTSQKAGQALLPVQGHTGEPCDHELPLCWRPRPGRLWCWRCRGASLICCQPFTGRTHQVRVLTVCPAPQGMLRSAWCQTPWNTCRSEFISPILASQCWETSGMASQ